MATFTAVYPFSAEVATTATLATVTSTAEIVLGFDRMFLITVIGAASGAGDFNLRMGTSGMAAASASDMHFSGTLANSGSPVYTLSTGPSQDRIRIFNPGTASFTYWIQPLTKS